MSQFSLSLWNVGLGCIALPDRVYVYRNTWITTTFQYGGVSVQQKMTNFACFISCFFEIRLIVPDKLWTLRLYDSCKMPRCKNLSHLAAKAKDTSLQVMVNAINFDPVMDFFQVLWLLPSILLIPLVHYMVSDSLCTPSGLDKKIALHLVVLRSLSL